MILDYLCRYLKISCCYKFVVMDSSEKRNLLFIGVIFKKVEKFRKKGISEDGNLFLRSFLSLISREGKCLFVSFSLKVKVS